MKALLLFIIVLLCAASAQAQTIRYVAISGDDHGGDSTCFDSAEPCRTIAHAISVSSSTDHDVVEIGGGIYTEMLSIGRDITLNGDGEAITIIQAAGSSGEADGRVITIDGNYEVEITDLTIRHGNPIIDLEGGGIYNNGAELSLLNVTITGNRANSGGGMYNLSSSPTLTNVTIIGNQSDFGGGMFNLNSDPTLTNVTITGNFADGGGGMVNGDNSFPTLTNVTITGNFASGFGGGMVNSNNSNPTLTNTIVWENQDENGTADASIFNDSGSSPTITYSLVQGWELTEDGNMDGTDPANNPLFVMPVNPVNAPTTGGDLSLQATSPAVNAGNPDTDLSLFPGGPDDPVDLAGEPRVFPGNTEIIDLGAYEFQGDGLEFATSVELRAEAGEGWRFLTSPVVGETYGGFLAPLWTQGVPGANYSDGEVNVYRFDPSSNDWSTEGLSLTVEDGSTPEPVEIGPGNGFIVYVFEDDEYGGSVDGGFPKTLESSGDWLPLDGSFAYSGLEFNDDPDPDPNVNFYLLGNPHPIPLDFCEFTSTNVAGSIDIWDPAANGGNGDYEHLNCDNSDPEIDVHIAPFQAFWVRTTATSPQLSIPEEAYLTGTEEGYFKQQIAEERSAKSPREVGADLVVSLHLRSIDETFANTTRILLSETGTPGLDEQDGLKRSPAGLASRWLNFSSLDEEQRAYAFQSLPSEALATGDKITIPLDIETTESGRFTLEWSLPDPRGVGAGNYFLRDNRSGKVIELREGGSYRFEIEADVQPFQGFPKGIPVRDKPWKGSGEESTPRFELLIAAAGVYGFTELGDLPKAFELVQNYPNPFNPSTVISYQLPAVSQVRLEVYDMLGRRVATLVDEQVAVGRHQVHFDAGHLSSGVYLYRLSAHGPNGTNQIFTKKLTLIK